jgi:hypothetical protein
VRLLPGVICIVHNWELEVDANEIGNVFIDSYADTEMHMFLCRKEEYRNHRLPNIPRVELQ